MSKRWSYVCFKFAVMILAAGIGTGLRAVGTRAQEPVMSARYHGYFSETGWGRPKEDKQLCISPGGNYLTAIKSTLSNQPQGMTGTVEYQVNSSGSGWLDWVEHDEQAGTVDPEAPIEAIRMKLTGELTEHYDIYYSVFQSDAWSEWSKNETVSGVEGQGQWVYGIRVSIVIKDGEAPPLEPPASTVDPLRPMVALTFDDGPNAEVTGRILNSLEAHGGRATFFMVGNRVPKTAGVVSRMVALGCEVGNHTQDHQYLTRLGEAGIRSNVGQASANIASAGGVAPILMRPTGGYYDGASLATLSTMGMPAIMWSIDTRDWQHRNPQRTIQSVLGQVRDGDIILMHDIHGATAAAVEVIIPELTARGYQLVTVSEMAAVRGGMAPGRVYTSFHP